MDVGYFVSFTKGGSLVAGDGCINPSFVVIGELLNSSGVSVVAARCSASLPGISAAM